LPKLLQFFSAIYAADNIPRNGSDVKFSCLKSFFYFAIFSLHVSWIIWKKTTQSALHAVRVAWLVEACKGIFKRKLLMGV